MRTYRVSKKKKKKKKRGEKRQKTKREGLCKDKVKEQPANP